MKVVASPHPQRARTYCAHSHTVEMSFLTSPSIACIVTNDNRSLCEHRGTEVWLQQSSIVKWQVWGRLSKHLQQPPALALTGNHLEAQKGKSWITCNSVWRWACSVLTKKPEVLLCHSLLSLPVYRNLPAGTWSKCLHGISKGQEEHEPQEIIMLVSGTGMSTPWRAREKGPVGPISLHLISQEEISLESHNWEKRGERRRESSITVHHAWYVLIWWKGLIAPWSSLISW